MPYAVQTPVFEGPFDLLLHLILREQVDLYEVSLCQIVDAYLATVQQMTEARAAAQEAGEPVPGLDLEVATEFLLIAATLIELKSKRLLPEDADVDLDDELALWEERDLLLSRLVECKTFKDAAQALASLSNHAARSAPRVVGVDDRFVGLLPDLLNNVEPDDLRTAFLRATAPTPVPRVHIDHIHQIRITVSDAVTELLEELPEIGEITFAELTGGFVERIEVVVRFLAVLELFKQGFIDLDQPTTLAELRIVWIGEDDDVPHGLELVDAYDG